jgi:hypothetical protein
VNSGKADQVSDDLATKQIGNIPILMLWQTECERNSKKALYSSKY